MAAMTQRKPARKSILIAYATTHGHTGKVAQAIARAVDSAGAPTTLIDSSDNSVAVDIDNFDGVIVAASRTHAEQPADGVRVGLSRRAAG
jgi:menaquinone-dependent protoporphyrinogen IX oxidase